MLEADLERWRDAVEVGRQQLGAEIPWRDPRLPRHAGLLVGAEHHAAALLPHVDLGLEVDGVRQLVPGLLVEGDDLGHVLGHQVHMLHGQHRQLDADHAADLARPQPAAIDDVLGLDGAGRGDDVPAAVGARRQVGHPGLQMDLGAVDAGRFGVGMGGAGGVEIAVGGVVHGADEIALLEQRKQPLGFRGAHQRRLETEIAGPGMGHLEPLHALLSVGQHQAAGAVQAAGLAGDLLQLVIEPDGVALQLGDVGVAVQRVEAAGGVPGRAGGQLVAFDQHDVAPPRLGQVVEHAAADDPAADHHRLRMRFHGSPLLVDRI